MQVREINVITGVEKVRNMTAAEISQLTQNQPAPIPQQVSRFQAKAALAMAGKLAAAEAAVAASGNIILQLAWAEANDFRRDSPGINALAPLIGLDAAGLDALFITAAGVEA